MDDAVNRYKKRRETRRRMRKVYDVIRCDSLASRFDDDSDETGDNSKGGGGHGNTRIPFGLCQREGIEIGEDWTPKDAWDALSGKGYNASEVYEELKKTGRVSEKKESPQESPEAPKAPETPKTPEAPKERFIDKRRKLQGELEEAEAAASSAKKAYEKAAKKGASSDRGQKKIDNLRREAEEMERALSEKRKELEDFEGPERQKIKRYNERPAQRAKIEKELAAAKRAFKKADDEEWDVRHSLSASQEEKDEAARKQKEADARVREKKAELKAFDDGDAAAEAEYHDAAMAVLERSPHKKDVEDYLSNEEALETSREKLSAVERRIAHFEHDIEFRKRFLSDDRPEDKKKMQEKALREDERLLKEAMEEKERISSEISERERIMREAKERTEADGEDWDELCECGNESRMVTRGEFTQFKMQADSFERMGVKYKRVRRFWHQPSEEKIIKTVGGADRTSGSCASLVLAYFANKAGLQVLDFRGGDSRLSMSYDVRDMLLKAGGKAVREEDGIESALALLDEVEEGKEYAFVCGEHAAAVRRKNGQLEWLELQSDYDNGWSRVDKKVLKQRFGCGKYWYIGRAVLLEGKALTECGDFAPIMGYINTAEEKQRRGSGGSAK